MIVGFMVLGAISGLVFYLMAANSYQQQQAFEPTLTLPDGEVIPLRIADSESERVQGLSGVDDLAEDEGMLFLFPEYEEQGFWMKDMLIPLDIIWIDGEEIVGLDLGTEPENPPETIYYSPVPVDKVLEVNAGFVDEFGLEIGDILDISEVEEYSSVE